MLRLLWDQFNVGHIAEHSVTWQEAEEVIRRARHSSVEQISPDRFRVRGQTSAGRYLQVIYVLRPHDKIDPNELNLEARMALEAGEQFGYVIHARDLRHGERRTVRQRKR
jgi:hypothetical protein